MFSDNTFVNLPNLILFQCVTAASDNKNVRGLSFKKSNKNTNKMRMAMRPRVIQVERGSRGFGLSLIYRGLDKFEEKDTGIFVARVVPGGQAARYTHSHTLDLRLE